MSYDANGNIQNLNRAGLDQLSYSYAEGNKLLAVIDATGNTGGFADGNTGSNDYDYWPDGSVKKDLNRGIAEVQYNLLKLPRRVSFTDGRVVSYQYDASGRKLRMSTSGQVRDYTRQAEFVNGLFYGQHTPEGRFNAQFFEYFHRDHLGNIRAVFRDSSGIATLSQQVDYDPWGLELSGLGYRQGNAPNRLCFNGKEALPELDNGLLDFGARGYDAAIGRWGVVDPLAEVSRRFSPFVYGNNNPVRFVDPDGMQGIDTQNQGFQYTDGYSTLDSRFSTGAITFGGAYHNNDDGQIVENGPGKPKPSTQTNNIQNTEQGFYSSFTFAFKAGSFAGEIAPDFGIDIPISEITAIGIEENNIVFGGKNVVTGDLMNYKNGVGANYFVGMKS